MSNIAPRFSISQVDGAGRYLRSLGMEEFEIITDDQSGEPFQRFLRNTEIIDNWRASHALPMWVIRHRLSQLSRQKELGAVIVQRLKRRVSISIKLKRFGTRLSKMQDIGGCRAIVRTVDDARVLAEAMRASGMQSRLVNEKNYIACPKPDGYRSIHQVYEYRSKRFPEYKGLHVEIQIRSWMQHAWATAVETVDTMTKESIKLGGGSPGWKEFFVLASSFIAELEGCEPVSGMPTGQDLRTQLIKKINEVEPLNKLLSFQQLMHAATQKGSLSKAHFFLLILDPAQRISEFKAFRPGSAKEAVNVYDEFEREQAARPGADAVLVRAESLKELRQAYPNYFADTSLFIKILEDGLGFQRVEYSDETSADS